MTMRPRRWRDEFRIRPGQLPSKYTAYFDGCCEPKNPGGTIGYGAMIFFGKEKVFEKSGFIPTQPTNSNNVAEYKAFIEILDWLIEYAGSYSDRIIVHGDSMLVIEQMFGSWSINSGFYTTIAKEALVKRKMFSNMLGLWIPREENSLCDDLSKRHLVAAGIEFRLQPK